MTFGLKALFLLGFLSVTLSMSVLGQGRTGGTEPVQYAIIDSDVQGEQRIVQVLMDAKGFSRKTVSEVFRLIEKRFSTPESLNVIIFTNLADVPTPEEMDEPSVSGSGGSGRVPKSSRAIINRTGMREARVILHFSRGGTDSFNIITAKPL